MEWLQIMLVAGRDTLRDVLPIVMIIIGFQLGVLRRPIPNVRRVIIGFFYVTFGMGLFLLGLAEALFPLGKLMARQLTHPEFILRTLEATGEILHWSDYKWVYLFAAALGFSTTIAEPALLAVARKANQVSGGAISARGLRLAVAIGAALGVALGCLRITTGAPLHYFIIAGYIFVIVQTIFAPRFIIALAYDSGGVTTSTVTVPLVTALGLGLAASVPGRSPIVDGFGLIALTCLFPIITVMGYAQLAEWRVRRERARRTHEVLQWYAHSASPSLSPAPESGDANHENNSAQDSRNS
ncbi:MAG: DUF1538 domain-containing protein [Acidiferrobacterales bacterium]|nr:DUF1538 domain-containing protein [Acidiferrobacterales bacterium]